MMAESSGGDDGDTDVDHDHSKNKNVVLEQGTTLIDASSGIEEKRGGEGEGESIHQPVVIVVASPADATTGGSAAASDNVPPSPVVAKGSNPDSHGLITSAAVAASSAGNGGGGGGRNGNGGGWDYPPPVASPVGRLLLSSSSSRNNNSKIWYPLPIEWRTPQRLFTLDPSSSSSTSTSTSSKEPAASSSSTTMDPKEGGGGGGGGGGDSAVSTTNTAAATTTATATAVATTSVSTTASGTMLSTSSMSLSSMAGTGSTSDSGDNSNNITSKKTKTPKKTNPSMSHTTPVRSCLCAPIILRKEYVLVAVNEDTLVLYGNLDIHHHHHHHQHDDNRQQQQQQQQRDGGDQQQQKQQEELRSDSNHKSTIVDTGDTDEDINSPEEADDDEGEDDDFFPLPVFSTPPLVQCSLASLVLEVERKKQKNDDTTTTSGAAAAAAITTMDVVEWNIVQMVWIEESNTLYVLMDDSYVLKLHIHLPPSTSSNKSSSSTSSSKPSIELEQYWMSDNLGVTCMAVQHSSQSTTATTGDGTNTYASIDMLYLGFETGMVEGWKVHHHRRRRQIHSSANNNQDKSIATSTSSSPSSSQKANNNRGSPIMSRRPSASGGTTSNKTFVGPSASSLMSSRRPSFNKVDETYETPSPVLMWTGSFPMSTISSLAVLPKTGPRSDVESTLDEPVRTDASMESRRQRPIEPPDEGIEVSKKSLFEGNIIARENSFASSIHSASGSITGPPPSSSPRSSPYTRRSVILPSSPLPRPPSFVSPSMSKEMDVNHTTQSLPAAFLVVVTIQRRLRSPSSVNEDDSDQPTSSMVQFLDLKRILSDSMNDDTSAPAMPSPRTTGENTGGGPAADVGAKTVVSLLDYTVNRGPSMDLIDSSTAIFENQDGRLPKPSRTMAVRGADLTTMILSPSLSTGDENNMNNGGSGSGHRESQQQEGAQVGVMLPDGTAAILSSSSVSNGNDNHHSFVGLHDEYHQFLLPFPAIGTGAVYIQDRKISSGNHDLDQQTFLACCARGGTCYLLPTSSVHNDQRTSPNSIKRRIRTPIHAFAFPHDVDTDLASIYVQSFTAGGLVVDSNRSEVPVMMFSSPGGTVDVYSCELLPTLLPSSSILSSLAGDKNDAAQPMTHGDESDEDRNDFHFLPRAERMVLEDMVEDGTIEVFLNIIREIKIGDLETFRTLLDDKDAANCWDDVVDIIASSGEDDILPHLEGDSVDALDSLCSMPRMRPVRELLLSLALESA